MRTKKKSNISIMDMARANLCIANKQDDEFQLEAFMATFHPEKQKDRQYMNKLKRGIN